MRKIRVAFLIIFLASFSKITFGQCGMTLTTSGFNTYCGNTPTGQAWVTIVGGQSPYTYSWNNGATDYLATGLVGGTYTVWVTDATSCSQFASRNVQISGGVAASATGHDACSICNGSATANVVGGTSPYTFSWAPNTNFNWSPTVTGLCPGIYTCTITDANGCIASDTAIVGSGNSTLAVTLSQVNQTNCNTMGSITANASGGVSPYTYYWSPTTQTTATITGLLAGVYTVTVTDALGCSVNAFCVLPLVNAIQPNPIVTQPGCTDGIISLNPSGGNSPYTYSWSNNSTSQSISNLAAGNYMVVITDVLGCTNFSGYNLYYSSPGPGCSYVSGNVFWDLNMDCVNNNTEQNLAGTLISAQPGNYYETTDGGGNYNFVLPYGTYTISQTLPVNWYQECPNGNFNVTTTSLNNNITNQNFSDTVSPNNNLAIWHYCPAMRPGSMQHPFGISYKNLGNTLMNGTVWFKTDDTLIYLSANPAPSSISNDTLYWNFTNLGLNQTRFIYVLDSIPADVNLIGYNVSSCSGILPISNDIDPSDNNYCCSQVITGSYDPNLKEVSPKGIGPQGYITDADSVLNYTIHFQNTGTDTAFTIIVRDTLSPNLDMATVESGPASNPYTFNIYGTGILKWTFNNILLPDSNVNERASHGYVAFRVKQRPNLVSGTVISNNAGIYFDYNPPVITNTVVNTISTLTAINNIIRLDNNLIAYPNPFVSEIGFEYEMKRAGRVSISLFDLLGNKVFAAEETHSSIGKYKSLFDLGFLPSGIYIVQVKMNDGDHFVKIVKQ